MNNWSNIGMLMSIYQTSLTNWEKSILVIDLITREPSRVKIEHTYTFFNFYCVLLRNCFYKLDWFIFWKICHEVLSLLQFVSGVVTTEFSLSYDTSAMDYKLEIQKRNWLTYRSKITSVKSYLNKIFRKAVY